MILDIVDRDRDRIVTAGNNAGATAVDGQVSVETHNQQAAAKEDECEVHAMPGLSNERHHV